MDVIYNMWVGRRERKTSNTLTTIVIGQSLISALKQNEVGNQEKGHWRAGVGVCSFKSGRPLERVTFEPVEDECTGAVLVIWGRKLQPSIRRDKVVTPHI